MSNEFKAEITWRDIATIKPYENNAKLHSKEQVSKIATSIKEFGWDQAIVIDGDGIIIKGHGRALAAAELGLAMVPVTVRTDLTPAQVRAARIADNAVAESGWNKGLLSLELQDLKLIDFDVKLIGFDSKLLKSLLAPKLVEGLTDPNDVPADVELRCKPGDLWLLGNSRLMCGDSTSPEQVARLMNGQKADMIFTDPPWNVNYGAVADGNAQGYKPRTIMNDHMDADSWVTFVDGFCASLYKFSKAGAPIYLVMSAQEWPTIDAGLRKHNFHWSSTIIWAKDRLVLSRKDYHTQYEPIWYGWNGDAPRLAQVADRTQSDVWNVDRPSKSELHPTTKPIELIERALNNSSMVGDCVLELFGGSGSTLIACEKNGRTCNSMELDPKYASVIVKRWEEFTGKSAVLSAD